MNYTEKIRALREKLYLSQEALAKELGVNYTTVSRWETGKTEPNFTAKKALAELCKINGFNIEKYTITIQN